MTWTCDHCGLTCGDYAGGYGCIADERGTIRLCHPNDPSRPSCFRRITIYREPLGALLDADPKPAGLDGMLGQDIAISGAVVCTTHMRFIPCRKQDGCVISEDPEDVARVSAYQRGATDAGPV